MIQSFIQYPPTPKAAILNIKDVHCNTVIKALYIDDGLSVGASIVQRSGLPSDETTTPLCFGVQEAWHGDYYPQADVRHSGDRQLHSTSGIVSSNSFCLSFGC